MYYDNYKTNTETKVIRNFLKFKKKRRLNSIYFNISQNCLGLDIFKHDYSLFKILFYNLKNLKQTLKIFSLFSIHKINSSKSFDNVFITWGEKKNYDRNGNFYDSFFNISSKNKKNFFIIVNKDCFIPTKLQDNTLILSHNDKILFVNYLKLFFYFIKNLRSPIFSIINLNWQTLFKIQIEKELKLILKELKFKNCMMNYEGHPYQDYLLDTIKKKSKKTHAYISSIPSPYPINFFYLNKNFIDFIYVYSVEQKKMFNSYLKWPKNKIKIIKPIRFLKNKFSKKPKIYFPINIINFKFVINNFIFFLENSKSIFYPLKIKFHPSIKSQRKNSYYKKEILKILKKYKNKFNFKSKNKYSFFIGPTSSIIEALENNIKVIQLCDNEVFDLFNNKLWKNLKITKLSRGIFNYQLKKKNNSLLLR